MNAAILLSRQSLYPTKKTPWVSKLQEAILFIKSKNFNLITSVGMNTWELQLSLALQIGIKLQLIIPVINSKKIYFDVDYYIKNFSLTDDVDIIPLQFKLCNKEEILRQRDLFIINKADIIFPISIRDHGFFSDQIKKNEKNYDLTFLTSYSKQKNTKKNFFQKEISKKISMNNEYIIHWTRTNKYQWPDETSLSFYYSILESDTYPRSAFKTLQNIIAGKKIFSSARHMSNGEKCVSFTNSSVFEFVKLMRWRSRYTEMSFEPYGLGIEKKYALEKGIFKVVYLSQKEIEKINKEDRWIFHTVGEKNNWGLEDEYRFYGDFSFDHLDHDKLICYCPSIEEAAEIEKKFGIKTFSIF